MNYTDWESQVVKNIKSDVLWKMEVYRLSLFSADIGWFDVTKLVKDTRTQNWYFKSRHILGNSVIEHRIQLLTEIIRLLLTIIQNTRKNYLKESQSIYQVSAQPNISENDLTSLLQDIPY